MKNNIVIAKNLLLGNSCKNCYYHDNPYNPASLFCLRHHHTDFIIDKCICDKWHTTNILLKQKLVIDYNVRGQQLTQNRIDKMILILETKDDNI